MWEIWVYVRISMIPTFKDLVDFVLQNKTDKVFVGCSEERIIDELQQGLKDNTLAYAADYDGKLIGMILAERDDRHKRLFVTRNLAMSISTLRLFASKARELYPNYELKWVKNGCHKSHNTARIYKKLLTT